MPGIRGTGAWLQIDDAGGNLTNAHQWLDTVNEGSDTEELDGTTFQPNVAAPIRSIVPGFRTRSMSLTGKWSGPAELFFTSIEGFQNLDYVYGPDGNVTGKTKISGIATCLSYSGPQQTVSDIISFNVEMREETRLVTAF
jgi:hypothetical protein